ncbi:MAG: T9SS type A sorting domain-containing protein [Bacteroidales bacterium]|jgi:hypothetical protein
MKNIYLYLILATVTYSNSVFSQIDSLYLGQIPPGETPKIFELETSPGYFIADRIAFSSNGKTIVYSETTGGSWTNCKIKQYKYQDGTWQGPIVLFSGPYHAPAFSIDDSTLFFDVIGGAYYSVLTDSGWIDPVRFEEFYHYLQQTASGNYYASVENPINGLGSFDVSIVSLEDGVSVSIGAPINTTGFDGGGFAISKDETIMALGLNISVKNNQGNWSNPIPLPRKFYNPSKENSGMYITDDNKYLFFTQYDLPNYTNGKKLWVNIENFVDSLMAVTSVTEIEDISSNLSLFPNPTNKIIQIQSRSPISDYKEYTIINLKGVIVKHGKSDFEYIDVSMLASGIYFIQIQSARNIVIKKFIVK